MRRRLSIFLQGAKTCKNPYLYPSRIFSDVSRPFECTASSKKRGKNTDSRELLLFFISRQIFTRVHRLSGARARIYDLRPNQLREIALASFQDRETGIGRDAAVGLYTLGSRDFMEKKNALSPTIFVRIYTRCFFVSFAVLLTYLLFVFRTCFCRIFRFLLYFEGDVA